MEDVLGALLSSHGKEQSILKYTQNDMTDKFSVPMKLHLLKCTQSNKNDIANRELTTRLVESHWWCQWRLCVQSPSCTAESVAAHMSNHLLLSPLVCAWGICKEEFNNSLELHDHLHNNHNTHTTITIPTRARFCFECSTWISNEREWISHYRIHANDSNIIYGPVIVEGLLAAPRRCPFCVVQGIFIQFESNVRYIEHIEEHIRHEIDTTGSVYCPHHSCTIQNVGMRELRLHLNDSHNIPI
jgi:hypothetical protein